MSWILSQVISETHLTFKWKVLQGYVTEFSLLKKKTNIIYHPETWPKHCVEADREGGNVVWRFEPLADSVVGKTNVRVGSASDLNTSPSGESDPPLPRLWIRLFSL